VSFLSRVGSFLGGIRDFFLSFVNVWQVSTDDIEKILTDYQELRANLQVELKKLKHFSFDPKWKSRVINAPIAIDAMRDLAETVSQTLVDKVRAVIEPLHELVLVFKSEQASLQGPDSPSKIARAVSFLHSVETALQQTAQAFDAAKDLSEMFLSLTDTIEHLDTLFLQQGNSRKTLTEKSFVRIGKLHGNKSGNSKGS
jgi:hypothetical protein